jgi:P27 family predicted phage terminase small subunit
MFEAASLSSGLRRSGARENQLRGRKAVRGRPPKAAALRILEGNPGHRPIPIPPTPPIAEVRCPAWLDALAKAEWRRIAPLLDQMHLLTALDVAMLASYCSAYSELQQATEILKSRGRTFETPSGYKQQRPEVGIAHRATLLIRLLAGEFGLSPTARMRLAVPTHDEPDDDRYLS